MNQSLPGVLVALLALIVASTFVLATQVVGLYGARSVLILSFEPRLLHPIVRSLALSVTSLVLGGQIPDRGRPAEAITAAVTTLLIATVVLFLRSIGALGILFASYTAPRNFVLAVLRDLKLYLDAGKIGFIGFRTPLLAEMIRSGLRRGDSVAVSAGLEGLTLFQQAYLDAVQVNPTLSHQPDETGQAVRSGWLGSDLGGAYHQAGEEALKSISAEKDLDLVAQTMEQSAQMFIEAKLKDDALPVMDAISRMGVTSHQVSVAATNIWSYSAPSLARLEAVAESQGMKDMSVLAVMNWAMVVSYAGTHFLIDHPLLEESIAEFGADPPWDDALRRLADSHWQMQWANKLEAGTVLPRHFIMYAAGRGPHPTEIAPPEEPNE